MPGTLSAGVSRQSLTGGKGNLLGMGDRGGASGSEYITPRVGGKVEKVASKGGKETELSDNNCCLTVLSSESESL